MSVKKVIFSFIFFALIFTKSALAYEEVKNFSSVITVNQDTSISITETIDYYTDEDRHGIYRYIPFRYHRDGLSYTAKIRNVKVSDKANEIPFTQYYEQGNLTLKIGDPDTTFVGDKTYQISYNVENAITLFEGTPELYWDITGEGWTIPITKASATVVSPHSPIISSNCFSGVFGSNDELCKISQISRNESLFEYDQIINYGDNLTVLVKFGETGLIFPTEFEKNLKRITDNLILLPLLLPGIIMFVWWLMGGRDKIYSSWNVFNKTSDSTVLTRPLWFWRPTALVYEPIKELTPGQAGALHDERAGNEDVIAEIIDLARLKLLSIKRLEAKNILSKEDYLFTKLKTSSKKLPEHQQYLLDELFKDSNSVKLSELRGSFYQHMAKVKTLIMESLYEKKLFLENPDSLRIKAFVIALVLLSPAGWWMFSLLEQSFWMAIPLYALSVIVSLISAFSMPAKSAEGSNLSFQVAGLRETIKRGAWREKIKEKHLFFEEVLPFAVSLGVVKQLSKDMETLNVKPPQYLPVTSNWSTSSFASSFSSTASSNLSYNPSSGSYGSSSGGSSGGGGGGGGGGSW